MQWRLIGLNAFGYVLMGCSVFTLYPHGFAWTQFGRDMSGNVEWSAYIVARPGPDAQYIFKCRFFVACSFFHPCFASCCSCQAVRWDSLSLANNDLFDLNPRAAASEPGSLLPRRPRDEAFSSCNRVLLSVASRDDQEDRAGPFRRSLFWTS
ncbi:hypothetical protein VTI74DRAFT_5046 [Chaetomium olivicolor]